MFVCCDCCVLSGRGLCNAWMMHPEESYWLWCVVVCDLETSWMRWPWPALGSSNKGGENTGCHRRKGPNFRKVFLRSNYNDITQKNLYPKFNGYGDIGQRSLKFWQPLLTYWFPNTYWNWQEYMVSVMLISVHNIKVTCEWHKAIK